MSVVVAGPVCVPSESAAQHADLISGGDALLRANGRYHLRQDRDDD
jgi:hypothetical protein